MIGVGRSRQNGRTYLSVSPLQLIFLFHSRVPLQRLNQCLDQSLSYDLVTSFSSVSSHLLVWIIRLAAYKLTNNWCHQDHRQSHRTRATWENSEKKALLTPADPEGEYPRSFRPNTESSPKKRLTKRKTWGKRMKGKKSNTRAG